MPGMRPMGRFISSLYCLPPIPNETVDGAAARWVAATEPCVECGRWLEPGDGYTCEQDAGTGQWRVYCAECLIP
jgi:hypothetical protein